VDVPYIPGTYICNIGDMTERWTNDLFRSTKHRVVNMVKKERYSLPLFSGPTPETIVRGAPGCCAAQRLACLSATTQMVCHPAKALVDGRLLRSPLATCRTSASVHAAGQVPSHLRAVRRRPQVPTRLRFRIPGAQVCRHACAVRGAQPRRGHRGGAGGGGCRVSGCAAACGTLRGWVGGWQGSCWACWGAGGKRTPGL
jgi:hypothetical protein